MNITMNQQLFELISSKIVDKSFNILYNFFENSSHYLTLLVIIKMYNQKFNPYGAFPSKNNQLYE